MCSFFVFFFFVLFCVFCHAHQPSEGKVLGTVGPFLYQTHAIHSHDTTNLPMLVGAGIVGEGDLSNGGGIEVGFFYIDKTYDRVFGNALVVSKIDKLYMPVGYRYWFNPTFSGGAFFSSLFSVGDPRVISSSVVGNSDQSTSATALTEYAVDISLQYEVKTGENFSVILDGRYSYSLSANPGEDANQYGLLIGLKYMIQEK